MKKTTAFLAILAVAATADAQVVFSDDYDVTGSGTGFALDTGVNSGINPPATRLGGSASANLRYLQTATGKAASNYSISGNKLTIAAASGSGRFTLSADGATPFDFGSSLGAGSASAANPLVYDVTLSMANNPSGTQRFSFGLGSEENNANFWDFGIQLYRSTATDNFYQIGKRIDLASYTTAADGAGTTGDINTPITATDSGTFGGEISFLMRVTDAGAETATFNSRVQLSKDGGTTWFYDTASDSSLTNGFRFNGEGRYFIFDQAGGAAATYDDFTVTIVPEPSTLALVGIGGAALLYRWRRSRRA